MDQRAEEETGNYLVCVELLNLCFPAAVSMDFILHRQLFLFFLFFVCTVRVNYEPQQRYNVFLYSFGSELVTTWF